MARCHNCKSKCRLVLVVVIVAVSMSRCHCKSNSRTVLLMMGERIESIVRCHSCKSSDHAVLAVVVIGKRQVAMERVAASLLHSHLPHLCSGCARGERDRAHHTGLRIYYGNTYDLD